MFENVLTSAIYGAIGGGGGALIGHLLSTRLKSTEKPKSLTPLLVAVFAVLGTMTAKPLLSPIIDKLGGTEDRRSVNPIDVSDAQIARIMTGLRSDPLVAALLDKESEFEAEARAKLTKAYGEGGLSALSDASVEVGVSAGAKYMPRYYRRAQDADLVATATFMTENIEFLADLDPEICYAWQYASFGHVRFDFVGLIRALGDERFKAQQQATANVVLNAFDVDPVYDEAAGAEIVRRAGIEMLAVLEHDKYDLINGRLAPSSSDDMKAACNALGVMFRTMINSENPSAAIRYAFALSGQK